MAVINKNNSFMEFPLQISRQYSGPIDKYSVFYSLDDASNYSTTSPIAYVGQLITVVDEASNTAKAYMISNSSGELTEVGKGVSDPIIFVANESELLALTEIEIGQQVFREDKKTIWIFKGGDSSKIANWVESASQNDTVWNSTTNKVKFYATTQSAYDEISSKDANTLYFISDTKKIYKGSLDVTSSVICTNVVPEISEAIPHKLYIDTQSLECKITIDGANWLVALPGYLSDGANWATADSNKLATIGLIKSGIQSAIDAINLEVNFDSNTGNVTVGSNTESLTGVAHDVQYDASKLKLTIPVYGSEDLIVNIPKDKFVTSGKYYENYPEENPTHHKVIVLTIDNQEDPVIIPADALVNIYSPDNEGNDVVISISEENKISAKLRISGATGGKFTLTDSNGSVIESSFTALTEGDMTDSNTEIPVSAVIKSFVTSTISALESNLNKLLDKKLDKLTGVTGNLLTFASEDSINDSGKRIGGAVIQDEPDSNTVATEAAVVDAISWKPI